MPLGSAMRTRALISVGLLGCFAASLVQAHPHELLVEEIEAAQIEVLPQEFSRHENGMAQRESNASDLAATIDSNKLQTLAEFRLRFENNSSYGPENSWNRGVLRGRLAASFELGEKFKLGTRVVTGDPNNPRSTGTNIGDFARDFDISLDQIFGRYTNGRIMLVGGKFQKPFASTELVWDGDVNPQGFAGRFSIIDNEQLLAEITGVYFAIDEATSENSKMLGGQLSLVVRSARAWQLALDFAYYDYDIARIETGLPGGSRGNNMLADGVTYLSDFDLLDGKATIEYFGLGENWPLQFVADYVVNRGAKVSEDSAYGFDFYAGHLKQPGRLKFRYGYAQTATDAVLGLFSHDNIRLATNFRLHTFSIDYALPNNAYLGLTHYLFRQAGDSGITPRIDNDWTSRTRLNLYFVF